MVLILMLMVSQTPDTLSKPLLKVAATDTQFEVTGFIRTRTELECIIEDPLAAGQNVGRRMGGRRPKNSSLDALKEEQHTKLTDSERRNDLWSEDSKVDNRASVA